MAQVWVDAPGVANKRCRRSMSLDGQWSHLTRLDNPLLASSFLSDTLYVACLCSHLATAHPYHLAKFHSLPVSLDYQSC